MRDFLKINSNDQNLEIALDRPNATYSVEGMQSYTFNQIESTDK